MEIDKSLKELKNTLPPLQVVAQAKHSQAAKVYFGYYQLHWPGVKHYFGYFHSRGKRLAGHIWLPKNPKATVFYLHGYTDHVGSSQALLQMLVESGYAVASFDHIGHGLSEGDRGCINGFKEYIYSLEDFLVHCDSSVPRTRYLMGHSMGGGVAMDYCFKHRTMHTFEKLILLAPLTRIEDLFWVQLRFWVAKYWKQRIKRTFTHNTSDKAFQQFQRHADPLTLKEISMKWLREYFDWFDHINHVRPSDMPTMALLGDKDQTIDSRFSHKYLEKTFRNLDLYLLKGARHHLPGEGDPYQSQVFEAVLEALDEGEIVYDQVG